MEQSIMPVAFEGLTKKEIAERSESVVAAVLEKGNVFEVAEALSAMEEFVKVTRKDPRLVNYLREELTKNNGKVTTASGAKVELCETGISYDYSQNPDWVVLDNQIKSLSEQRKQLEDR